MRTWFQASVRNKKRELTEILREMDGDIETIQKDVFTRLTLADVQDGKDRFTDSDIVSVWILLGQTNTMIDRQYLADIICWTRVHGWSYHINTVPPRCVCQ